MRSLAWISLIALAACGGGENGSGARDSVSPAAGPGAAAGGSTGAAGAADSSSGVPAPATESPRGIVFDPAALSKGSRVGTLEADMLTVSRAADSSLVGSVRFSGELTLTGRAIPHFDSEVHEVCFEADAASAAGIPRWSGDTRRSWFCFSNQPEAQRLLAALHETRPATVVVDRFTVHRGLTDQVNSAELVRVVKRGDPGKP